MKMNDLPAPSTFGLKVSLTIASFISFLICSALYMLVVPLTLTSMGKEHHVELLIPGLIVRAGTATVGYLIS